MELAKKSIVEFVSLEMEESKAKRIAAMLPWWGRLGCLMPVTVDEECGIRYKIPDTTRFNI